MHLALHSEDVAAVAHALAREPAGAHHESVQDSGCEEGGHGIARGIAQGTPAPTSHRRPGRRWGPREPPFASWRLPQAMRQWRAAGVRSQTSERLDGDQHRSRRGPRGTKPVLQAWRRRLARHYAGGPPPNAPFDLVPAVVSSYGGWHPEFAQWWRGAVRAAAERTGSTASLQGMLWRTVGFLSVTLQRQNFQVLAGCAPSLAEHVEGRLGRPLSEAPEFWRAAPEEAILWASDELGYPPSPRGGLPVGGDPEGDHLHATAGNMRAAGLRL